MTNFTGAKKAILAAAGLAVCAAAARGEREVIYRELFTYDEERDSGQLFEDRYANRYGWRWASRDTIFRNGGSSIQTRIAKAPGAPVPPGGAVNSRPMVSDTAIGCLESAGAPGANRIYFCEEFPMNAGALQNLEFRWAYHNSEEETFRALVAVASPAPPEGWSWHYARVAWYVTEETVATATAGGWSADNTARIGLAGGWRELHVSSRGIEVGEPVSPPDKGYIMGFGLHAENTKGIIRIDNFEVTAPAGEAADVRIGEDAVRCPAPHEIEGVTHHLVFKEPGRYAAFPTLAIDPRNDHLYATFSVKDAISHTGGEEHERYVTMASRDGGVTWEEVEAVPASAQDARPGRFSAGRDTASLAGGAFESPDGALVRIGQHWRRWFPIERLPDFEGRYAIGRGAANRGPGEGFFSINSGGYLERSEDGGRTWQRTELEELDTFASYSSPWSYEQLPDGTVIRIFAVHRKEQRGQKYAVLTRDGRTAEMIRIMGDEAGEPPRGFTEETLVHVTSRGVVWILNRAEADDPSWWQAVSEDGGRTWTARRTAIDGWRTPPSGLVPLDDGRLVLLLGQRWGRPGIHALLSGDEGLTWLEDQRIALRQDGHGFDLGYPRAVKLSDGTIVTVYYYSTGEEIVAEGRTTRSIVATRFRLQDIRE